MSSKADEYAKPTADASEADIVDPLFVMLICRVVLGEVCSAIFCVRNVEEARFTGTRIHPHMSNMYYCIISYIIIGHIDEETASIQWLFWDGSLFGSTKNDKQSVFRVSLRPIVYSATRYVAYEDKNLRIVQFS